MSGYNFSLKEEPQQHHFFGFLFKDLIRHKHTLTFMRFRIKTLNRSLYFDSITRPSFTEKTPCSFIFPYIICSTGARLIAAPNGLYALT